MARKIGEAVVEVSPEMSKFAGTLHRDLTEKLHAERGRFVSEAGKVGQAGGDALGTSMRGQVTNHMGVMAHSVASMLGNLASSAVTATVSAAATGLKSLAVFGVGAAADMQSARVSFDLMLGSAQKSADFLAKLQQFAVVTPFELADLRTYASRLLGVGVNADRIIPMLRHIGDATAAVGTGSFGIERAVNALNNMKLAGDVSMIHLKELAFAGVPIFDALAGKLGKTTAQIVEMVSANEISVDQVFDAVEQGTGGSFARINGMMDKQSATLLGKWSNLKDSASQTFGKLFEPALPGLSKLVEAVGTDIPLIIDKMKAMAASPFGQRLFAALDKAGKDILPVVRKAFSDLGETISKNRPGLEKFGNLLVNDVIPALAKLAEFGIPSLIAGFAGMITVVSFIGNHFQQMKNLVIGYVQVMFNFLISHLGMIVDAAATAFGWVPGLGPKLKEAQKKFHEFVDDVNKKLDGLRDRKFTITAVFKTAGNAAAASNFGIGGQARQTAVLQKGGWVPGRPDEPMPILAHGGEYVLSREMLRGTSTGGQPAVASAGADALLAVLRRIEGLLSGQRLVVSGRDLALVVRSGEKDLRYTG
jgi:tape measure domain-containing protein